MCGNWLGFDPAAITRVPCTAEPHRGSSGAEQGSQSHRLNFPDYALMPLLPAANLGGFPGMLAEHVAEES